MVSFTGLALIVPAFFGFMEYAQAVKAPQVYRDMHRRLGDPTMKAVSPGEVDPKYRNITVTLLLVNIVQLNPRENFLDAVFWILLKRKDPRLTWDSPSPETMILPSSKIWIPDYEIFNGLTKMERLTDHGATIGRQGQVLSVNAVKARVPCDEKDSNNITCNIKLGSWAYSTDMLQTVPEGDGVLLQYLNPNPKWNVVGSTSEYHERRSVAHLSNVPWVQVEMVIFTRLALIVSAYVVYLGHTQGTKVPDVYREMHKRLGDTTIKAVAPGEVDPKYRNVTVNLILPTIVQLNPQENFLEAIFWITADYTDPRLTWDASTPAIMVLPSSKIWIPDFEIANGLSEMESLTNHGAIVGRQGEVLRVTAVKIRVPCDEENNKNITCKITLGSWAYSTDVLQTVPEEDGVILRYLNLNPKWNVVRSSAEYRETHFPVAGTFKVYSDIMYTLTFRGADMCGK